MRVGLAGVCCPTGGLCNEEECCVQRSREVWRIILHVQTTATRVANRTCVSYPIGTGPSRVMLNRKEKKKEAVNRLGFGPWSWAALAALEVFANSQPYP
jgi:hypothetical protein